LVLYLLSRDGFECARIDHTGIDLLAKNRPKGELMGISVKSRSRYRGTETAAVSWDLSDFKKAEAACEAFGCKPYYAVVVDSSDWIRVFLLPLETLKAAAKLSGKRVNWRMTRAAIEQYKVVPEIKRVELTWSESHWWKEP
jgi:hypothetical protein